MSNVALYFTADQAETEDEYTQHRTRLCSIVQSCGYKLCDIAGDGNCCFTAIVFTLLTQQDIILSEIPTYFADKQLPTQCSLQELARVLREKAVKEWLDNPHEYQGFLSRGTVEEAAPKFLQNGFTMENLEIPWFLQ